ncbi:MAG TPA: succinate--CoA ligase subunit beta, partial [Desulfobulbaceae bacterium]|nr:succinate--CoA ligase subunit beta [Desulfobulbaceae bacterium]
HEYQAKELFRKYQVPTPQGGVSNTVQGISEVAAGLGLPVAVKAQI